MYLWSMIQQALSHTEQIKSKIPKWAAEAILENAEIILSVLKEKQLGDGKDSNNQWIGFYKTITQDFYAKDPYNKPRTPKISGQPYTMEWSGEFFDSLNLRVDSTKSEYDIFSSVGKDKFLENIYGRELTDLTDEHNTWVNVNIIEPYVSTKIEESFFDFI